MKLVVELELKREKNEFSGGRTPQKIGTLYLQKWAVRGQPKRIRVVVEVLE